MGKGNVFPGGPTCEYNGKQIPVFVTNSKSGGITPEILVDILKHLVIYGITDRNYGITDRDEGDSPPCLLMDGHDSRLSMPFLRYINNLDGDGGGMLKPIMDGIAILGCLIEQPIGRWVFLLNRTVDSKSTLDKKRSS